MAKKKKCKCKPKISARAETNRVRAQLLRDGLRLPHGYKVVVRKQCLKSKKKK
ncbi:MAG: hypothetical protein WA144_15455 [Candidatus Methanoperedens sp.]